MPRVGADLVEELLQPGEHAGEHPVVDPVGHPGRGGVAELGAEDQPVLLEEPGQPAQPGREHLLVPVAVDHQLQHPGQHRRGRRRLQPAVDQRGDRRLDVLVAQQVAERADRPRRRPRPAARPGRARRGRRPAGRARRSSSSVCSTTARVRKFSCTKAAQALADLVLLARDDRGVRDRQPQRVPEQRGDGEPVGQRADHRGLGGRPHVADPAPTSAAEQHAGEEDHGGEQEQPGGQPLHPASGRGRARGSSSEPASGASGRGAGTRRGSGAAPASSRTPRQPAAAAGVSGGRAVSWSRRG